MVEAQPARATSRHKLLGMGLCGCGARFRITTHTRNQRFCGDRKCPARRRGQAEAIEAAGQRRRMRRFHAAIKAVIGRDGGVKLGSIADLCQSAWADGYQSGYERRIRQERGAA